MEDSSGVPQRLGAPGMGKVAAWVVTALLTSAAAFAQAAPVIDSFTASSTSVAPGASVTLNVAAHDPDCPGTCTTGCSQTIRADLTQWSATGGSFPSEDNGTTASPYTAGAVWQAPATEGTFTLTVMLSDSGTFLCGGRQTTSANLAIQVTTTPNQAPVIDSLTAAPAQLFPDQTAQLACAAHDPDGEPVTYSWNSDLGTVTDTGGGAATFSSSDPGIATVTCTATDPLGAPGSDTVRVSVTDAVAETVINRDLVAPQRLAVDTWGDVFVVDRAAGGLTVVNLFSGQLVYRLPLSDVTSVAVDWAGRLLVGRAFGAQVLTRRGNLLLNLSAGPALGGVADVAVDLPRQRYGVLYRRAGRVVLYGAGGGTLASFGSVGDGPGELKSPAGLAFTPGGDVVVADSGHGLVRIFDTTGTLLRSFGGLGGGAGEFVQLDDVAVDADGVIFASDAFQDWVQTFNPDGTLREVLGTYGDGLGEFMTAAGVASADLFSRLVVASVNSSQLQVFRRDGTPPPPPAPRALASPPSVAFGAWPLSSASTPRAVTITNGGSAPLGIREVRAGGDFRATNDCGSFLDPGASCTVSVTFTATALGARGGSLLVETSDPGAPVPIALSGSGFVAAGAVLTPGAIDFPDQLVGSMSPPETVILSNSGTVPLSLASIATEGDFAHAHNCPASLPAGGSCTVTLYFTPSGIGDFLTGRLIVESSSAGSPHAVLLEGRGVAVDLSPVPGRVSFGMVPVGEMSPVREVVLLNTGTDFIHLGQVAVSGDAADAFLIEDDGCSGLSLFIDQSCTVKVAFQPGREGALEAVLSVPSDSTFAPEAAELVGIGLNQAVVEIPTLSQWGLMALALLLGGMGMLALRRRRFS